MKLLTAILATLMILLCWAYAEGPIEHRVLDPNEHYNWIGQYPQNTKIRIKFSGSWKPGLGHPYWGPTGDPAKQGKWGVMITATRGGDLFKKIYHQVYTGGEVDLVNPYPEKMVVTVSMLDDIFGDNENDPKNPMTATWHRLQ